MNPLALLLFLVCSAMLLSVSRKWAPVPLLVGCTYMTTAQGIELGPISLPIFRMLLLVGVMRTILRGESLPRGLNRIDKLMMAWCAWMIFASFFHRSDRAGFVYSCGVVFNIGFVYYLIRVWCTDLEEIQDVIRIVAILLVPIGLVMLAEKANGKNMFSVFGGVPVNALVREGKLRAQGPFGHPILAGTVGATCIPLFIGIMKRHRIEALIGIAAGVLITFASASSGPVMSLLFVIFALCVWRVKSYTRAMRIGAVVLYFVLMLVMKKPPYYLISRIDISGGSTGWHRSFLIEQTFNHLSEWWLFGTDFTRHWMPMQGFARDPYHTDITNYYIGFGVDGGLPAMILVILMLLVAFHFVGQIHDELIESRPNHAFMIWCFGACLFSHALTSISVAYYDQSMLYFWLSVAVISSVYSVVHGNEPESLDQEIIQDPTDRQSVIVEEDVEWRRVAGERTAIHAGFVDDKTKSP